MIELAFSAQYTVNSTQDSPESFLNAPYYFMNLFSYLQEVRSEMGKVVWPTKKQVVELTVLVIAISIIVGVYVGGLDFVFTNVLNKILGR